MKDPVWPARRFVALATAAVLALSARGASDALWDSFQSPPREARASTYWWWKGDLSAPEMGRQLRLLKAAGLGGAHIIPWQSQPAYLSPEWLELLKAAVAAARQEGMVLDLSANASWPFRGTWVLEEESLQKVDLEIYPVTGPQSFALPPKPAAKGKKRGALATARDHVLIAQLAPDPTRDVSQLRDVTAELSRGDSPRVQVPAGRHILRIVRRYVGVKSQPDFGRVPDHFNPTAIEHYLEGFKQRVAPALGGRLSNGLRALYCDSIEISEANWTTKLPEEFRRRCGYDLMPYLPLVLAVDAADQPPPTPATAFERTIARARHDFCRVLTELFLDGLARPFYRWCHDNGVVCRWQAYGWPDLYGMEDGYRIPDMPEGNNWLLVPTVFDHDVDIQGWPVWQKYASSGGHLAGRRITSTEAATVTDGKFKETLDLLKRADDFNFVCGINHSFLHGFCYSPAGEPFPGRNQYGTYFSEHNPWWPYLRRWMDYNARLSSVFQASRPVAQVALFFRVSDIWAEGGLHRHPYQMDPPWAHQVWRWINQNGADADYVSDQVLQQATFADGRIAFGPMRYDALIVLDAHSLVPATADALDRYARAGGKIVFAGNVPETSAGLKDAAANDRKVHDVIRRLLRDFPRTVVHSTPPGTAPIAASQKSWKAVMETWRRDSNIRECLGWADQVLRQTGVSRSVRLEEPVEGLYHTHYRHDAGGEFYFFANMSNHDVSAHLVLSSNNRRLERWDPETVSRHPFSVDSAGRALVKLPPAGSLLLLAEPGEPLVAGEAAARETPRTAQEIAGPWSASFQPANGSPFDVPALALGGLDQSADHRLNRFAGTVIYRVRFTPNQSGAAVLDLGAVRNCVTEVTLNGRPLGVRWYGRHEYDVRDMLRSGENELEVKAATNLFNAVRTDRDKPQAVGLVGPVVLRRLDPAGRGGGAAP